jgi:hypothetical protein
MYVFRQNLRRAIDASPYSKSISRLSIDAALGEKTLTNMLNDKNVDIAKAGPGIFGMKRVADLLGVSLDYLVGKAELSHPSPTEFMTLYASSGGLLDGFKDFLPFMDIYLPPKWGDTNITVLNQGEKSLSARSMPTSGTSELQGVFNGLAGSDLLSCTIDEYISCQQRGCISTIEELNNYMPNQPAKIKMDYIRTLALLRDTDGKEVVANYSFEI